VPGLRLSILDQSPVPSGTSPAQALASSVDLARLADRLGYHRFWVAEHHGMEGLASTAPEILIARLTGETSGIRLGSGAVLLPHYSPMKVAETFRMLHALAPGRIDLGIGRAPGGTGLEAYALRRDQEVPVDDFPAKLAELLAFLEGGFPAGHPFGRIRVSPALPDGPPVWLLGSSAWSADAAAELGLPYAFAHFISPKPTAGALQRYRAAFAPSRRAVAPTALVCLGAVCAASREEAERLFASARLFRRRVRRNDLRPVRTPEEALAELGPGPDPLEQIPGEPLRYVVGTPDSAAADLRRLAEEWQVEELMIVAVLHDHDARMESYRLLATALGLERA
jgi:luciferase family oxidoreductase group 1